MPRALLILAFVLVAACARYESAGFDTVGPGYVVGGGEWNTGGGITAVARVLERDGRVVVCGAWASDRQSAQTLTLNYGAMEAASVYAGGRRLVQDLGFMTEVPGVADLAGASARCVTSPVPWRTEFGTGGLRLRFPRLVYIEDQEVGNQIVFREAVRPNVLR